MGLRDTAIRTAEDKNTEARRAAEARRRNDGITAVTTFNEKNNADAVYIDTVDYVFHTPSADRFGYTVFKEERRTLHRARLDDIVLAFGYDPRLGDVMYVYDPCVRCAAETPVKVGYFSHYRIPDNTLNPRLVEEVGKALLRPTTCGRCAQQIPR